MEKETIETQKICFNCRFTDLLINEDEPNLYCYKHSKRVSKFDSCILHKIQIEYVLNLNNENKVLNSKESYR